VRWPTCQGTFWGPSTRALPGSGPSFDRAGGGKKFKAALTRLPGRGGLAVCNPLSDSLSCSPAIPKNGEGGWLQNMRTAVLWLFAGETRGFSCAKASTWERTVRRCLGQWGHVGSLAWKLHQSGGWVPCLMVFSPVRGNLKWWGHWRQAIKIGFSSSECSDLIQVFANS